MKIHKAQLSLLFRARSLLYRPAEEDREWCRDYDRVSRIKQQAESLCDRLSANFVGSSTCAPDLGDEIFRLLMDDELEYMEAPDDDDD